MYFFSSKSYKKKFPTQNVNQIDFYPWKLQSSEILSQRIQTDDMYNAQALPTNWNDSRVDFTIYEP